MSQSAAAPISLSTLNSLEQAPFVAAIGFVFEDSPWVAERVWRERPFASLPDLHQAMCRMVAAADQPTHLALLRAHPDLAGQAAQQGTLGAASRSEQTAAGLGSLTPEEAAEFARLNGAYWQKFGFPFGP